MASDNFVGRGGELHAFRRLVPNGKTRILFVLGDGGIGKTLLIKKMLDEAQGLDALSTPEPIDLFSTDYHHIDGIQWKIKEIVESLPAMKSKPSPFAGFIKDQTDTSEKFHECLKEFCASHPLVLAFDTFERLDKVAGDWLFSNEEGGLQVPGLICIVAGRDKEIADIHTYCRKPFVKAIHVSGFTLGEANEFYQKIADEFVDPLGDFLKAAGIEPANSAQKGIEWIWKITDGHPLRLEMAFRWSGTLLSEKSLTDLTAEKFEERLMMEVRELSERGLLDVGPLKVSQPVFDTLVCMAYITRRFDDKLLRFLVNEKLIRLGDPDVSEKDILDNLQKYFFVKVRPGIGAEEVIQLHDEMARLVRDYIWPYWDNSGEKKLALLRAVDRYYDQLIVDWAGEESDILRVEKLHYALERDWKEEGKRLWSKLAGSGNDNIKKLLPGEIKDYIKYYDVETQYEVNRRIAEIESDAHHFNQSIGYWEHVRKLGEAEKRPDWVVDALVGKFNASWQMDPEKALKSYLEPARKLAEVYVPAKKVLVYYEIGFAYRQIQDMEKAIKRYERAIREFRNQPVDDPLRGTLLNDAGYVYALLGRWGEATRYLNAALDIRKNVLQEVEKQLKDGKPDELDDLQQFRSRAVLFVGMSYNTLGEFHRHAEQLDEGLTNYEKAYEIFAREDNYYWQAKSLAGRGETYRRLALQAKSQNNLSKYNDDVAKAQEDTSASLYLCEKNQLNDERDTAYRRLGRLSHDLAFERMKDEKSAAQNYLEEAYNHFVCGLEFARKTNDVLEELENRTELAFLFDDALETFGSKKMPAHYKKALGEFENALEEHAEDKPPIYHLPVFQALLKLEKGAVALTDGDYGQALNYYLEGYSGLAVLPGYGIARYKQHFPHLARQIEKLQDGEKARWCEKFIETWETTLVRGKKKTLAEDDLNPGLVIWCKKQLNELDKKQ